jgi:hypothetical protein
VAGGFKTLSHRCGNVFGFCEGLGQLFFGEPIPFSDSAGREKL